MWQGNSRNPMKHPYSPSARTIACTYGFHLQGKLRLDTISPRVEERVSIFGESVMKTKNKN